MTDPLKSGPSSKRLKAPQSFRSHAVWYDCFSLAWHVLRRKGFARCGAEDRKLHPGMAINGRTAI
jgi:hypothetical protein